MPEADTFEAPQGKTFHAEPLLQSVTEAFVGNGVLANGDATVTADGATSMGVDVAAADDGIAFGGDTYTPSAASFTLSDGPTTTTTVDGTDVDDSRVDLVYFDSGSGSYAVTEGTADAFPVPPAVPADALMLAVVLVPHEATDLGDPNILNWQARPNAAVKSGGASQGGAQEASFEQGFQIGVDDEDITESSTPASFTFTAGDGRDVHLEADVTISNSSGASATEDVTVELYDGTGTGGTLLQSETQSVSLNDGASTTNTFITTDESLDGGEYHINITTSGTDLSIDETVEKTDGLIYSYIEQDDGTHEVINRYTGTPILSIDPFTDEITFPNGAVDTAEISDGSITTAKIADDAVTAAKIASGAVGTTQLADDAVTQTQIASGAVGGSQIIDGAVDTADLANDAVTQAKIASGAVGSSQIIDGTVTSTDISDGTIVDADISSSTVIARSKISDERVLGSTQTGNYTTSGEEVIPVDPTGTGGLTITLATADLAADASSANFVVITDVGGTADNSPITVDTEGAEGIDGGSTVTVDSAYGATVLYADDTKWYTAGGGTGGGGAVAAEDDGTQFLAEASAFNFASGLSGVDAGDGETATVEYEHGEVFEGSGGKTGLAAGNQAVLIVDSVPDTANVAVFKGGLVDGGFGAVPTGVDLELVTLDNAGGFTSRATIISGDGSTIHDRVTGDPLTTWSNTTGSEQTIAVLVDNASGASVDIGNAHVEGVTNE